MFQFTHPCGCDCKQPDGPPHSASFNSRTRVGATLLCGEDESLAPVSIHAPVWVRPGIPGKSRTILRFQFTHPCGCDMSWQGNRLFSYRFNSRTRVGATYMRFRFLTPNKVSIHAPVWVRLGRRSYSASGILFQFTHPCGCDIPSPLKRYATLRFNSRTRVGATFCQAYGLPLYEVSIHAPVWVRLQRYAKPGSKCQFQFTHPCGCDARKMTLSCIGLVSIHAPVWVRPPSP